MIVPEERLRLREALTQLVDGQMTNDQFDEFYYSGWMESPDRGVAALARFGWSLYSSDLPLPYRLKGRYAVDPETRRIADRCTAFLGTDREYRWPDQPDESLRCRAAGEAIFSGIPSGIALLIVAFLALGLMATGAWAWFACLAVPGCLILGASILLLRWASKNDTPAWREYWSSGNREAWPFLHLDEVERCSHRSHL